MTSCSCRLVGLGAFPVGPPLDPFLGAAVELLLNRGYRFLEASLKEFF